MGKKSNFIKHQEATELWNKLSGIRVLVLSDLPIANILFWKHKTNEIINKLLLAGDKSMLQMYLKQAGFTCSGCGLKRNKE